MEYVIFIGIFGYLGFLQNAAEVGYNPPTLVHILVTVVSLGLAYYFYSTGSLGFCGVVLLLTGMSSVNFADQKKMVVVVGFSSLVALAGLILFLWIAVPMVPKGYSWVKETGSVAYTAVAEYWPWGDEGNEDMEKEEGSTDLASIPPSHFEKTKAEAEAGDVVAQSSLGLMYVNGQGVKQDFKEAFKWCQKAAEQGNAIAQYNLGLMYYNGHGVEQNNVIAYAWWDIAATNGNQKAPNNKSIVANEMTPEQITKAEALATEMGKKNPTTPSAFKPTPFEEAKAKAEAGSADAQSNLGEMYENGKGVKQDFKEALKWFQKAADQGGPEAQTNVGSTYYEGKGVKQDFKEALKWYKKAADQGFPRAQFNVGGMYYAGQGVEQNNVIAYAWWDIAATNGDQDAKNNKSVVAKKMTPAQIAKAEELVKEMVKRNPKLLK